MRFLLKVCLYLAITLGGHVAQANAIYSEHFTLSNGMQVVVIPNHRVPAVSHMVWYKMGAIDEPLGKSGIAHFLEHLMFKGTETTQPGEFSSVIAKNGGNDNAFTSYDFTTYFQNIAVDKLPLVMEMEADRMQHLVMGSEEVQKERDVILEERSMRVDNKPSSVLSEQMRAMLYVNHPYGTPLIGWRHEMEGLTRADARRFYDTFYAPNNAVLVVAGDITAEKLKPLAEKYYGKIPAKKIPDRIDVKEPEQRMARRVTLEDGRVQKPEITRYYLAPTQHAGETQYAYALTLLAHILGGTDTSHLYQSLVVDKKLTAAAYSYYDDLGLYQNPFTVKVILNNGTSAEAAEAQMDEVIRNIKTHGVTEEELRRAKDLLKAEAIYARDGFRTLAYTFGQALTTGLTVDYVTGWEEQIERVSRQDIQEAAAYVLDSRRSVTGILLPKEEE